MSKAKPMAASDTMSHCVAVKRRGPLVTGSLFTIVSIICLGACRSDDLQQFNGWLVIAVNNRQAAVSWDGPVEPKPFHHRRIGKHAQKAARLDPAEDIVLNENAT